MLHSELQDIYGLESLNLLGNPIVNQNPQLGSIRGDESAIQSALEAYFAGHSGGGFGGAGAQSSATLSGGYNTQSAAQSQRVGTTGGLGSLSAGGSFKGDSGGFLARAAQ